MVCQHLYITTDEEIKEGDWFINTNFQKIYQANSENSKNIIEFGPHPEIRKIIATTDPKVKIITGIVGSGTGVPLPQLSHSFIEEYCKAGGIDKVMVEVVVTPNESNGDIVNIEGEDKVVSNMALSKLDNIWWFIDQDGLMNMCETTTTIITDSNNCIIIHPVEEKMYSKEELLGLTMGNSNIIDWINENL